MMILFVILVIVVSAVLGLIVLIQNPKGGGLAGSFGGFSNQFMGVKQTTDVLEKGTWIFGGIIALLCLGSSFFMSTTATASGVEPSKYQNMPGQPAAAPPANSVPLNPEQGSNTPLSTDSNP